jgi:hypothetical protein
MSSDQVHEVEPAIVSTTQQTIIVATRYDSSGNNPQNVVYEPGNPAVALPPPLGGYTDTGDPALAWYIGSNVYLAELAFGPNNSPNGIFVQGADQAGQNWTGPFRVATSPDASSTYDKPSIAVSNAGATAGYIYVAYTQYIPSSNTYSIWVARSTNGGSTFDQHYVPQDLSGNCACGNVQMSQVMVDPSNGTVYVSWVDYGLNQIRIARSSPGGDLSGLWTVMTNGPSGDAAGHFISAPDFLIGENVRALTVPIGRFDSLVRRIVLTWHARASATNLLTDVYYGVYNPDNGTWLDQPKIINNENATCDTDELMPAIDYDRNNGNALITYYSRQSNCGNTVYDLYFAVRDTAGSLVQSPTLASSFESDPGYRGFLGDYQDVFGGNFGGFYTIFYSAWIGNPPPSGYQDVMLTRIE